jgi:hypothetical protein
LSSPQVQNLQTINARTRVSSMAQKTHWQTKLAGLLILLLLVAPRSRIMVGAPLYFIDLLAIILLVSPLSARRFRWVPKEPFSQVISIYLVLIVISELRGMLAYGTLIESLYMTSRFLIAASIFFTLPRLISSIADLNMLLKGLLLGALASSVMVIMYSLGPLRPLIVGTLYSSELLNPGWQQLVKAVQIYGVGEAAMRGRSLVGAATMTAGFIASVWPLSFLALKKFDKNVFWKRVSLTTAVIAPTAVLMTYGRGAWIMVGSVVVLISVFGMASGRKVLLMAALCAAIVATQFDIDSDDFLMERLIKSSQQTIEDPFADRSTAERLLSYVEPFAHLVDNPIWLLAGSGRTGAKTTGSRFGGQLFDEGRLATHSAFSMAYYSFGFVAAICQVLLIANGFLFINKRLRMSRRLSHEQKVVWQSLFMCWVTLTLWWSSGHAIVGEPRGAMLIFFMYGLLVSLEKLRIMQLPGRPVAKQELRMA